MRLKIREILWRSFHKSPSEITNGNMAAVQEMWREAVPLHSTLLTWRTPTRTFESKRDVSLISYYIDRCSFGGRLWDKHRLFKQFFPTWSSWEHIKVLLFFFLFWILFCFIVIEVSRKIIFLHSKMHDSGFQLWVTAANRNAKFIIHSLRRNYRNSLACICNSDMTVYLNVISSFTFDSLVLLIKFLDRICLYYAN